MWAGSEAVTDARKSVAAFLLFTGGQAMKSMYIICIGVMAAAIVLMTGALT